jgi:hypothetical protein
MKKMRRSSSGLRIALLAGASVAALVAAAPSAGAADLSKPTLTKAPPPAPVAKDTWTWWIEGGAFSTGGKVLGVPAFDPNWGGEGAVGFDWNALPQMHVVGQFRYGSASKSQPLAFHNASAGGTTVTVNGTQSLREDHWLIDFGIGRDFGLGNSHAMWTLGVRVADLRSKLSANANFTAKTTTPAPICCATIVSTTKGAFSAQERSTFVGAGPRFGVQGEIPLGGQWSIDWLAGAAVLFGERNFQITATTTGGGGAIIAGTSSDSRAVFNVDAQAGLSYWFSPNMKFTVSYRFDDYFRALKSLSSATLSGTTLVTTTSNVDRSFSGPMARLTWKY